MENRQIRDIVNEKIKNQYLNIFSILLIFEIVTFILDYIKFPYDISLDPNMRYSVTNISIDFINSFYKIIIQILVLPLCLRYIRGLVENVNFSNISSSFNNLPKKICVAFVYTVITTFVSIIGLFPNKMIVALIITVLLIPIVYLSLAYTFIFFIADEYPDMNIINIFRKSRKINNRKMDIFCMGLYYMTIPFIISFCIVQFISPLTNAANSAVTYTIMAIISTLPILLSMPKLYLAETIMYDTIVNPEKYTKASENNTNIITDDIQEESTIDVK